MSVRSARGVLVAPDGVSGNPLADPDRPVAGIALVREVGPGVARLQQLGTHVLGWEVVDRQVLGLKQQQRPVESTTATPSRKARTRRGYGSIQTGWSVEGGCGPRR